MRCVLVLAGGAEWESVALRALDRERDMVVLKRCVDVSDLMATATTGQADVAVVAMDVPGLDVAATDHLRTHRVRVIAVYPLAAAAASAARARRIGISQHLDDSDLSRLADLCRAEDEPRGRDPAGSAGGAEAVERGPGPDLVPPNMVPPGRVVAVWGTGGGPGRTTVALGIAAELDRRGRRTTLIDADPWGGAVAHYLGVLDEVSGVLAGARLSASGDLDSHLAAVQLSVTRQLSIVTGLPRPDRWTEVRAGAVEELCSAARAAGEVLVDTGFSVEDDSGDCGPHGFGPREFRPREFRPGDFGPSPLGGRAGRNQMTLEALASADEVVVVGGPDPVRISRLARSLVAVSHVAPAARLRVLINRMRPSLGWSERAIAAMVGEFAPGSPVHFLPDDTASTDRAVASGSLLGDGPLRRALSRVTDEIYPDRPMARRARGRRERAGRSGREQEE
ncbi:MAG: hypothetical protein ACRCYQ_07410 [Nocardioides sp.]